MTQENKISNVVSIVLAGGSGNRLWPVSRETHPKQFLPLIAEESLIELTINRLKKLNLKEKIVICNKDHKFFVNNLSSLNKNDRVILESEGKNTAPAIALAALSLNKDDILLVLAADHDIKNESIFIESVKKASYLAKNNKLVTFGIKPSSPHTGYGYIELGDRIENGYKVKSFQEKPDSKTAKKYFESESFLWNSGMFMFKAGVYLNELKKNYPEILQICKDSIIDIDKSDSSDSNYINIDDHVFKNCESISIDYAVMEKTSEAVVVPMDADWSDIGSWSSMWEISKKDHNNNVLKGDVITHETNESYITSEDRLIATVGISNLVIVDTKDTILIADKSKTENIKDIVNFIKKEGRTEHNIHREVHRPWGKYDSIDSGEGFQVKRLTVYPKQKLSVQMHHHRSEHWVVVSGEARVHYGEKHQDLNVNESTYHDKEVVHALENISDRLCILIEVQVGNYLGEDDIIRFSDIYGRTDKVKKNNE